ncbi:hypothetical protein LCGC14_1698200 [marine sediment metagenome]|uniref:Uncharacterized protein n=1 Tax=marine sediment metagenome TaxID=412755 RepID=A0A0F9HIK3_9ZZZZ
MLLVTGLIALVFVLIVVYAGLALYRMYGQEERLAVMTPENFRKQEKVAEALMKLTVEQKVARIIFNDRPTKMAVAVAEKKDQIVIIRVSVNRKRMKKMSLDEQLQIQKKRCDAILLEIGLPEGHPRVFTFCCPSGADEMTFMESVYARFGA